ncbi:uncharacterized protein Tspo isoform X3 [Eurosta solidaginis]|uniref:uncharacterized protein Tspo isoform X3 n=1 Tax=Eurosta solidaginis TaxID=178769 RepID=UPI0035311524
MDKSEYEIQHFGFSVEQFSLERRHYLNKILSLTLQSMVEKLSMDHSETKELLSQKKEVVKEEMFKAMDRHLNDLEEMDRKNFCIPEYVLLATDTSLSKQYSEADENQADVNIEQLKRQFLENNFMIASLEKENEKYEQIHDEIEKEDEVIKKVQEVINTVNTQWEKAKQLVKETKNMDF